MPRYANFLYNTKKYGVAPRLQYNIDPFVSTAVDYGVVRLEWTPPAGDFFGVRIVRNQDGFPETAEDGVIAWEELHIDGYSSVSVFLDGVDNIGQANGTISAGNFVYYTYWVLNADNVWVSVGSTYCLMPKSHGVMTPTNLELLSTHDKFIGLLPRVFTTEDENPLGQPDTSSDLYNFLYPFSFTLDEFFTYTDFLLPEVDFKHTDPSVLRSKIQQLGLVREPNFSTKYQKRLLKNASYIYRYKGTKNGLKVFSESMTGYPVTMVDSSNKMLSLQDSTFKQGTGNWRPLKNVTISAISTVLAPTAESLAIETEYVAQVVVGQTSGKIQNGVESPVLQGVPVLGSTEYSFSAYLQKSATTGDVTFKIYWYDYTGALVGTATTDTATSIGTSWTKKTYTATSHADAAYAAVEMTFAATGTYYVDMVQFSLSSATSFNEARGITVFLNPSKTNYITNPSFETFNSSVVRTNLVKNPTFESNTTGWTYRNGTGPVVTSTAQYFSGTHSALHTISTSAQTGGIGVYPSTTYYAPVTPGQTYTYSIYVRDVNTGKSYISYIQWYQSDGTTVISTSTGTTTAISSSAWTRVSVTDTAPAGAAYGRYYTYSSTAFSAGDSGKQVYFDAALFEQASSAGSYFDGGTTDTDYFDYAWTGTANLSTSTSSILTPANWTTNGTPKPISTTSGGVYVGPIGIPIQGGVKMLQLASQSSGVTTLTTSSQTINPEAFYVFSIYGKLASGTSRTVNVKVSAVDADSNVLATRTTSYVLTYGPTVNSTPWTRMVTNVQVPAVDLNVVVHLEVEISVTGGGNTLIFEGAQLEPGYSPSDYFDGDIVDGGAMWVGTAHNSVSYQYVGITEKLDRLDTEISKYMPYNSSYVIESHLGVLAKDLT